MDTLFRKGDWISLTRGLENQIDSRIQSLTLGDFEQSNVSTIVAQMVDDFTLHSPQLQLDDIYQRPPQDIKEDHKTKYTFVIPFNGDPNLLRVRPSAYTSSWPYGRIVKNEIEIQYTVYSSTRAEKIRMDFDKNLKIIQKYISFLDEDITTFNSKLEQTIKNNVMSRKAKLDHDANRADDLGFPIK